MEAVNGKKKGRFFSICGNITLLVFLLLILFATDDLICTMTLLLATYTGWDHYSSPVYMSYITARWEKLPEVDATPIPELHVSNFTREDMLRLSNGLRRPIVIRGAIKETTAVKKWSEKYFLQNYASENVVVREMFNETEVRMQLLSFKQFFDLKNRGRNVSVVGSSSIFYRNKIFASELMSPLEEALVGPKGEPIIANQFFITPGGRSWYHSALGNNVFRQVAGQKRWTLIDPADNLWMCPAPVISGTSVNPCIGKFPTDKREEWVKRIPRITALLQPGDILINAGWWWHDVQSYGSTKDQMISVAGRIKNIRGTFLNSPIQTITALITVCNFPSLQYYQINYEASDVFLYPKVILSGRGGSDSKYEQSLGMPLCSH